MNKAQWLPYEYGFTSEPVIECTCQMSEGEKRKWWSWRNWSICNKEKQETGRGKGQKGDRTGCRCDNKNSPNLRHLHDFLSSGCCREEARRLHWVAIGWRAWTHCILISDFYALMYLLLHSFSLTDCGFLFFFLLQASWIPAGKHVSMCVTIKSAACQVTAQWQWVLQVNHCGSVSLLSLAEAFMTKTSVKTWSQFYRREESKSPIQQYLPFSRTWIIFWYFAHHWYLIW